MAIFFCNSVYSDSICNEKKFGHIQRDCLKENSENLNSMIIPTKSIKNGDVYFYKTSEGKLGKIYFHDSNSDSYKCSLHLDFHTFEKQEFSRSTSLNIRNYLGVWDKRTVNLDSAGIKSELSLLNYKGKLKADGSFDEKDGNGECYLETKSGGIWKAGNISESIANKNLILYIASILLIGFAAFSIAKSIFDDESEFKTSEALDEQKTEAITNKDGLILKYSTPFFRRYMNPVVNGMKGKRKIQEKFKRILFTAGISKFITPVDFYSFKLFSIITFPVIYLFLREFLNPGLPLYLVPVMAALGYIYPDIWIKSRAEARKKEIVMQLPFVVDMLALSVEAGLDFIAAMNRVLKKAPESALLDELEMLIKEIQLGATRAQALKKFSWRVNTLEVTSFCATLIAADSVGASVGPILKSLSGEIRNKRSALIEKQGATAATKLLMPTFVFILPAVVIVIFSPMALQYLTR